MGDQKDVSQVSGATGFLAYHPPVTDVVLDGINFQRCHIKDHFGIGSDKDGQNNSGSNEMTNCQIPPNKTDSGQNTTPEIPAISKSPIEQSSKPISYKSKRKSKPSSSSEYYSTLQAIQELVAKNTWKYTNKILNKKGSGQGQVVLMEQTINPSIQAALKVYKIDEKDRTKALSDGENPDQPPPKDTHRMRSHREMAALRAMKGISNVTHLIDTNIPDNMRDAESSTNSLWILMDFVPGCSLTNFIKNYPHDITLLEAVNFCIKLLNIIKSFHACGVVHRDIKPGNIHIGCQNKTSLDQENITVIDFGQAYIEMKKNTENIADLYHVRCGTSNRERLGNRFYRVPQLDSQRSTGMSVKEDAKRSQKRRSPTIDASNVCAILFWLLTDPKSHNRCLNHHDFLDRNPNITMQIQQKVHDAGNDCDRERIQIYLMHISDRGFAEAENQWTVEQLLNNLRLIEEFITKKSRIDCLPSYVPITEFPDCFTEAIRIFSEAKNAFVKKLNTNEVVYKWTHDKHFYWEDNVNSNSDERRNTDLLSCLRTDQNWDIFVEFFAVTYTTKYLYLFVGSIVEGVTIQLPVYTLSINDKHFVQPITEVLQKKINQAFERELCMLIQVYYQKNMN